MVNKKAIYIIGAVFALLASTFVLAQADPAAFVRLLPDQIPWVSNTSIPPGGQSVVVYGDPRKSGPYITRVRLPANYRIPPHSHPEERVHTVISGKFYIGFGDTRNTALHWEGGKKTAALGGRHSSMWWRWRESNSRPEDLYSRDYMLSRVVWLSSP